MRSFKSNENIHKKEGGPYHVVSANKAPPATPQVYHQADTEIYPGNFEQSSERILGCHIKDRIY